MFAETPLDNRTVNKFTAPPPAVDFLSTFSWFLLVSLGLPGPLSTLPRSKRLNISSGLAVL
jgi:hypothetical protein